MHGRLRPPPSRRAGQSDCRPSRYQGLRCSSSLEILRGADQAITSAIDSHIQAGQRCDEDDDGQTGTLAPRGLMALRSCADVARFGGLCALLLPRRLRPSEFRLVHSDRWLPPSLDISPSYTCGIGITARLLTVNIRHKLRQPILW